jgi:hypothetical protein
MKTTSRTSSAFTVLRLCRLHNSSVVFFEAGVGARCRLARAFPADHSVARRDARARAPGAAFPPPSPSRHRRRGRVPVPVRVPGGGAREADRLAADPRGGTRERGGVPPDRLRGPRVGLQPERRWVGAGVLRDPPGRGASPVLLLPRARRRRGGGHRRGRPRLFQAVRARALLDAAHRARSVFVRDGERRALRDASRPHGDAPGGGLRVRSIERKRHRPEPAGTRCLRNAGESRPGGPADGSGSVVRSGKWFGTRFRFARDAGAELRLSPHSVAGRSSARSLDPSFAPPPSPPAASLRDAGARAAALHPAARAAARLELRAASAGAYPAAAQDPGSALSGGGAVVAAPRARLRFLRGRAQGCRACFGCSTAPARSPSSCPPTARGTPRS